MSAKIQTSLRLDAERFDEAKQILAQRVLRQGNISREEWLDPGQ